MIYNRLLDFRPREQLEGLTDDGRVALLVDVLSAGPSEAAWEAICELFALWPDSQAKLRSLEQADRDLAAWDDRLRTADTSSRALFEGARLASLARIVKSVSVYRREDGGDRELEAIVRSEDAAHLTRLTIVRSDIGQRVWQLFIDSPFLASLRHFHVTNAVMGGDVVRQILRSGRLPHLECLKLIKVGLDAEAVRVTEPAGFALRQVDFSMNVLREAGAQALAQARWLQSVERLTLRDNFIPGPGMRALLSSPYLTSLKQIDLSGNAVTGVERADLTRIATERQIELTI